MINKSTDATRTCFVEAGTDRMRDPFDSMISDFESSTTEPDNNEFQNR